ncbi:MAG: hypothetical protein ACREJC_05420, partial [Tepidisphaeraceae bacterium]
KGDPMNGQRIVAFLLVTALAGCASTRSTHDEDGDGGKEEGQTVKLEQLPPAVKSTLLRECGSGKIEETEKESRHGQTVYESDVILDGKKWVIVIREDGQLLKKELDEDSRDEDEAGERK